ncbi:MAG TPA: ThiF family adenylyltransferase [Mycobacteriales bacterium]|nr:ThiF family adenylyltransferase [Mycobacteriales bacterium]
MSDPFRPRLNPALRRLWRDPHTLQLGVDPIRALVISDVDTATVRFLAGLDGRRTHGEVLRDAASAGLDVGFVAEVLQGLRRGDALLDGTDVGDADHLGPDRAALSLLEDATPAAVRLEARKAATVLVHGAGRVGGPLAALLAAAGVGAVSVVDEGIVEPSGYAPGGLAAADLRRARRAAAHDAVRRAAPEVDTATPAPGRSPDLTIFTAGVPLEPEVRNALHAAAVPHLVAGIRETTALIGPLVLPGRTSCLRCADLHRGDRDPDWPLLAMQLTTPDRQHAAPADVALAVTAAGLAGLQALSYLDGALPATVGGSLELSHPDWRIRRRTWPAHPDCGCLAALDPIDEPIPLRPRRTG